jgi:hypothetical protein
MGPVLEHHVNRDRPQVLEEAISRPARDHRGSPGQDAKISRGVEGERKQIEGDQDAGQGFLTVPEVVFEVVPIGFEHVEGLVLDLPTRPAAGSKLGDGIGRDRKIGDETIVIGSLSLGVKDLDGEPVDQDGVLGGTQRHRVEPAVDGGGSLAAFADSLAMLVQFGAPQVLGDGLMRRWLAGENEVAPGSPDGGWQANRSSPRNTGRR